MQLQGLRQQQRHSHTHADQHRIEYHKLKAGWRQRLHRPWQAARQNKQAVDKSHHAGQQTAQRQQAHLEWCLQQLDRRIRANRRRHEKEQAARRVHLVKPAGHIAQHGHRGQRQQHAGRQQVADDPQGVAGDHGKGTGHQRHHAMVQRGIRQIQKHQATQRGHQAIIHPTKRCPHQQGQTRRQRRGKRHLPGAVAGADGDQLPPLGIQLLTHLAPQVTSRHQRELSLWISWRGAATCLWLGLCVVACIWSYPFSTACARRMARSSRSCSTRITFSV